MKIVTAELRWVRKLVNPPYSVIDVFTIIGLLFILLTIPVITLNVNQIRDPLSRATNTSCSGTLALDIVGTNTSTLNVNAGQSVTVIGKGLTGCDSNDELVAQLWGFTEAPWNDWRDFGTCTFGSSSTECQISFNAPTADDISYPIRLALDRNSNSNIDATTDWKWIYVKKSTSISSCTTKPTLSMSKTSGIEVGETVTATVGGFSNCSGADRFTVLTFSFSGGDSVDRGSCKPSSTQTKCNIPFQINENDTYFVQIAYDRGDDGSIEINSNAVQIQVIKKVVVKKCSGTLNYTVNNKSSGTVNVNFGSSLTSKGTGLSDCTSSDKLYIQYWDSSNNNLPASNKWRNLGLYCNLSTSGSCTKQWTPSSKMPVGSWPTRMILNYSGNGTGNYIHNSGWVFVNIAPLVPVGTDPPYTQKPLNCAIEIYTYFQPIHKALDLGCSDRNNFNAEVRSVSSGTVVFNGTYGLGGYSCGYEVKIKTIASDGSKYLFRYCHLNGNISLPSKVMAGTVIGYADDTGTSSGSHLHLCVEKDGDGTCYTQSAGNQVDPRKFVSGVP